MPPGGVDKNKTEQQKRNAARAKAVRRQPAQPNRKIREAPKPKPKPAPPDILRGPYDAPNRPMVPTAPRPMPVVRIEAEKERTPRPPRAAPIVAPRPATVITPEPRSAPEVRPPLPRQTVPVTTPPEPELQRLRNWRGYDQPFTGEHTLAQGWGEHPDVYKSGGWAGHAGLDWGLDIGTPIQTLGPGRVIAAVENPEKTGYGTYVIVEHPNGDQTLYGHMSELNVQEGDEVGYGSILGKSGDSGFSFNESGVGSFPHLHLGYKPAAGGDAAYGNWADPTAILGQYTPNGVWEQSAYPFANTSNPQAPLQTSPAAAAQPRPWVSGGLPAGFEQAQEEAANAPAALLPNADTAAWRQYQYRRQTRDAERDATATALTEAQAAATNPLMRGWYGLGRGLNEARRAGGNFFDWYQAWTDLAAREPNSNLWGVPYRMKEDGTAEWIPPWTYRWNDPENRQPFLPTQPVIGPQPQNADVQVMPFGPFATSLLRGYLASRETPQDESLFFNPANPWDMSGPQQRRQQFAKGFNSSVNAYLQAQAAVNEIDDPDARVDAEIGLLAGTYIGYTGEDTAKTPQGGAVPAVQAIVGQQQTVAGLRSKAARLIERRNFVEAGKLLAQADYYESLTPPQLADQYKDFAGNLFVDMVFDPGNLLGAVGSVVGMVADAKRGARALAPAAGNLAMQADDALRRAAALKAAAGMVDDVTAATQAVDIRKVAGATVGEAASRLPFVKWFTLTPESYAKIRTGEVFHYASELLNKLAGSGELTAGDVLKVLATAVSDPMKLARGMAASEFTGPAARALSGQNPAQMIQWGRNVVVPKNLKQILPILAYALPDISKFKSLQNLNEVVDMAKFTQEFDDAIYEAARRLYGRSGLLEVPIGTDVRNGMKVVDAGNGQSAIVFMNQAGDILSQTAPMTTKEAKRLLDQWKKAARARGNALAAPFKAAAGAQRAIMTDFFLGLSPRNWILNAATAQLAMLIEHQSTLGIPVAQIDNYIQGKLGASMGNRRVYEGLMGSTSGLGGGSHWTDAFPNNRFLQAWGRIAKKSLDIPYGRTELPGGVGFGEQNLYTRAFYSVFKRVVDRNWDWMVGSALSNDLAQLGIDPRYAQRIIQSVQEAGRNGNGQNIVDALRQTITGSAAPPTVASLNVPAGLLAPDAEKALNQLMAERPEGWEQQALDIFKAEMQPHFETLAQAPPDYQVEEWIKATGVQDKDTVYSAIYEAAIGQGMPKAQAAQRAAEVSAAVNAPYDAVIKGVITDLRNMPANPAVAQQLAGGWAELKRLTDKMRAAIDKSSHEMFAMRRNPMQARGAWAHKEAATRAAVDKFVADRAEWLVRWRDNIQRAAAGEVLPDPQDWRSLLTEYMTYDETATQFIRGLEAGHGGTQQYMDIINAGRAYVDASYVRLFEAVRQNGSADALDVLYSASLQSSRIYAATVGGVDKAHAAAQAQKIPWEQFYTIRNGLWRKARDAEVLTNEYALRYIVADTMQKAGAATSWNGLTLVGPAGNGKWIARKPGEFAPQFVDEKAIPPEVLASWRRTMNPQTQAQSVDEAVAEIGRVTGTDNGAAPPPAPTPEPVAPAPTPPAPVKKPYTTPGIRPLPVEPRPGALEALRAGQMPPPAPSMQPEAIAERMAQQHATPMPGAVRDAAPEINARTQAVMDAAAASGMQNATVPVRVLNSINAHADDIGLTRHIDDLSQLTPEEAELVRAYYAKRSAPAAEAVQAAPPSTVERGTTPYTTPTVREVEPRPDLFPVQGPKRQYSTPTVRDITEQYPIQGPELPPPAAAPVTAKEPGQMTYEEFAAWYNDPDVKLTQLRAELAKIDEQLHGRPRPSGGVAGGDYGEVRALYEKRDRYAEAIARVESGNYERLEGAPLRNQWEGYKERAAVAPPPQQAQPQRITPPAKLAAQKGGKALTTEQRKWVVAQLNALVPEGFREKWPAIETAARKMGVLGPITLDDAKIAANRQVLKNLGDVPIGPVEIEIPGDGILRVDSAAQALNAADAVAKGRIESVSIPRYDSIPQPRKRPVEDVLKDIEDYNNSLGIIFDPISYQMYSYLSDLTRRLGGKRTQTVGDLATHQVTTLLDAQREFFAAMRRGPDVVPNTLTPQQRQAVLDLIYNRLLPAYDNLLGEAAEAGRRGADRTMLNYDRRRGFDEIMSILSPYHYYWSRAPLNWAMRLARHPGALGMIADWQNTWERTAEQQGEYYDPQRVEGKIPVGDTGEWVGNYLDRVLPFAGLMGNPFVEEDVAMSPAEGAYLWMKQQGMPLWGPLGEAAIAGMLDQITPRPEGAAPRLQDYGLADLLGPLGREAAALGQAMTGTIMPWWISGDQYRTGVAGRYLTTQEEGTPSEKMWALDVLQQEQQGNAPLPEQPEGVGQLAEQAVRGAGWQDALVAGIQGTLGIPNNVYTPEEAAMRELQASRRALGYNEETGMGSAAAVEGFDQETGNITYPFAKYTDLYPQTTLEPEERERLGITAARRDRSAELEPLYAQQTAELDKAAKALIAQMQSGAIKPSAAKQQIGAIYDKYEPLIAAIKEKYPSVPEGKTRTMPPVNGVETSMPDYGGTYYNMNPEEAQARALADAEDWAQAVTEKQLGEYPAYSDTMTSAQKKAWAKNRDAWEAARLENLTTILADPALMAALTYQSGLEEGQEPPAGVQDVGALPPAEAADTAQELIATKGNTETLQEFYAVADAINAKRDAEFQQTIANVTQRMGGTSSALLEEYLGLDKGKARDDFRAEHPEIRLALIAAYSPAEYDRAVKLFGNDALLAWANTPLYIEGDEAQNALREQYFNEHPETFAVNAWIKGRPRPYNKNADPDTIYDFGKDYDYAIKTWGGEVWNVASQYMATDKAGRRAMYRQYAWLDAFWDWYYELQPDSEKTAGKGTGSGYSRGFSGGHGGATYSNIGSGGAPYFPYWNTPQAGEQYTTEWGNNPFADQMVKLKRWRPPERRRMGVEPELTRLRNWR